MTATNHEKDRVADELEDPAVEEAEIVDSDQDQPLRPDPVEAEATGQKSGRSRGQVRRLLDRDRSDGPDQGRTGIRSRMVSMMDRFLMLSVKAVLFGIIAGLAGILTFLILQNSVVEDTTVVMEDQASAGLVQRVDDLENRTVELQDRIIGLDGVVVSLSGLDDELDNVRTGLNSLSERTDTLTPQDLPELRSGLQSLTERMEAVQHQVQELQSGLEEQTDITVEARDELIEEVIQAAIGRIEATDTLITPSPVLEENEGMNGPEDALGAIGRPPGDDRSYQVLVESLSGLASRISGIESALDELDPPVPDIEERVGGLESRLTASLDSYRIMAEQSDATAVLVEELMNAPDLEGLGSSLVIFSLEIAMATGIPYVSLLDDLENEIGELPDVLVQHAGDGIMTLAELGREFDVQAQLALKADAEPGNEGLVDDTFRFLSSLVQVRPLTPREGNSTGAILSRARFQLESGDIANAMSTLEQLSEKPMDAMSGWINQAKAREDVLKAVVDLAARVS